MPEFTKKDLQYLSKLCRIHLSEDESEHFVRNLKEVLVYIDQLHEIDTENVLPCSHVLENHQHKLREDEVGEMLPRDKFLNNAPDQIGGMIKVPPVLKS